MSPLPPLRSNSFGPVGIGWLNRNGMGGRVINFHSFSSLPKRGIGNMGWKIIRPPTRGWPGFRLPSEKLRSNSVNRAQTFESGFASFLAVSAASPASGAVTRSPGSTRASCPRAPVVNKTKANSSAAGTTAAARLLRVESSRVLLCSSQSLLLSSSSRSPCRCGMRRLLNYSYSPPPKCW
jgi:hypothetical protein